MSPAQLAAVVALPMLVPRRPVELLQVVMVEQAQRQLPPFWPVLPPQLALLLLVQPLARMTGCPRSSVS